CLAGGQYIWRRRRQGCCLLVRQRIQLGRERIKLGPKPLCLNRGLRGIVCRYFALVQAINQHQNEKNGQKTNGCLGTDACKCGTWLLWYISLRILFEHGGGLLGTRVAQSS